MINDRNREGWIAPKFEEWLDRTREHGLDRLLNLPDNARAIDTYIEARFLSELCLLVGFGLIYGLLGSGALAWGTLGITTVLVAFMFIITPVYRLFLLIALGFVILVVVASWFFMFLVKPSLAFWIAIMFIGLGLGALLDVTIARARDHLFQIYRNPEGFYPPRNLLLASISVVETIVIFALFYSAIGVLAPDSFPGYGREALRGTLDALWFSLATMFTADIGIKYNGVARVFAAMQQFVGLFFFGVILATLVGYLASGSQYKQRADGDQDESTSICRVEVGEGPSLPPLPPYPSEGN